jgi:hypothetical protein
VVLVNEHRTALGLAPLATSPTLTAAATWKARHLARYGYFTHDDPAPPVARTVPERIAACGYPSPYVGENIAKGQPTPAAVVAAWLASPGHRENMERPSFGAIGVGVASDGTALEWVQDFGDVADAGSVLRPLPAAPPPPPPAPTGPAPPAPPLPPPFRPAQTESVRVHSRCRAAGRRVVRCRVRVSRAAGVRAALRRRGRTYAVAHLRRLRAGRAATVRLRARRRLAAGRYRVALRIAGRPYRRFVRVR